MGGHDKNDKGIKMCGVHAPASRRTVIIMYCKHLPKKSYFKNTQADSVLLSSVAAVQVFSLELIMNISYNKIY